NSSTRMTAARKSAKAVCPTSPQILTSEIPSTPRPRAIVTSEERNGRIRALSAESSLPLRLRVVPLPAIHDGRTGKAGTASYGRHRKRCLGAGFWPAITRRQSPLSPLARQTSLAAVDCGLRLGARDPEARRHYWQGHNG